MDSRSEYPDWLRQSLVDDFFPWEAAQRTTMINFLAQYSLHDSLLEGLWLTASGLLLLIIWDALHAPDWFSGASTDGAGPSGDTEVEQGDDVPWRPNLLIRFSVVYAIQVLGGRADSEDADDLILRAGSRTIPRQEAAGLPLDEPDIQLGDAVSETVIVGGLRRGLRIIHDSDVSVLWLDDEGSARPIPRLQ